MASTPVEVKQAVPADPTGMTDIWQTFRSEMDRLFDRFGFGFGAPSLPRMFMGPSAFSGPALIARAPAVEISEDDTAWRLTAELPGLSETDVEVVVTDDVLTLRGEKKQEREESGKNFHISERSYGSFARSFALPDGVDREGIGAEFAKGVLTVTLPKQADAKAAEKVIPVKATG
jgi:HSP20 family protein